MISNETYELWYFFPDGQAIGGQQVKSDEYGDMITSEGIREILIGSYSSSPIPNGLYKLGIVQGKFTYKKTQFRDWEEQSNLKHHISFAIPCKNELVIKLDDIGKVPNGSYVEVKGELSTKGNSQPPPIVYSGKIISFKGTGSLPYDATVDENGRFSSGFNVDKNIRKGLELQATFGGDEHYAQSSSDPIAYETISDGTMAYIENQPAEDRVISNKISSSQTDNNDRSQTCEYVLSGLYEITRGTIHKGVYSNTIAERVGFDIEITMDCIEYLESSEFVTVVRPKPSGVDYHLIHITSKGVKEIEKSSVRVQQEPELQSNTEKTHTQLKQDTEIFISYAKEDSKNALKLYDDLDNQESIKPWIDEKSILGGQKWEIAITKAIRASRFFIALLSSNSVNKTGYVQKELKEALDILEQYPEPGVCIIPARLDDCKVSDTKLQKIQYIDLFPNWDEGFGRILDTIKHNK